MKLKCKKVREIMEQKQLTAETISRTTGLSLKSLDWILENGYLSADAFDRIADALGVAGRQIVAAEPSDSAENGIEFLKDDERATVQFVQGRYKTRIRKLAEQYPEECQIIAENRDGSLVAHIPTAWVKIGPPRTMSEEQRQKKREIMAALNSSRHEIGTR